MANHRQNGGMSAVSIVILTILLAIILRASLEAVVPPLISGRNLRKLFEAWPPAEETLLRLGQFFVFLILLARFYGGAYRFNEAQHPGSTVSALLLNVGGTFGLFSLFYVVAVNVWTADLFYALVLLLHIFDAVWFLGALMTLEPGAALIEPVKWFLLWDALTLIIYLILFGRYWRGFLSGSDFSFQLWALAVLLVISATDWWVLRDFYFRPDKWRASFPQTARQS